MAVDPMELVGRLDRGAKQKITRYCGNLDGAIVSHSLLIEAAACIRSLVEWQPIETAPKDGTEVVVLVARKRIRLGWYFAPSSRTAGWRDENGKPIKPTHWTPMPLGGSDA